MLTLKIENIFKSVNMCINTIISFSVLKSCITFFYHIVYIFFLFFSFLLSYAKLLNLHNFTRKLFSVEETNKNKLHQVMFD